MTDEELIEQLRSVDGYVWYTENGRNKGSKTLTTEAADRIEKLLEGGKGLAEAFATVAVKREMTEAKLAKAIEALRFTDDGANHGAMTSTYGESALRYILRGIRERVRAVLAELEETE